MSKRSAVALAFALSLAGCFTYVPTELGTVPPGERVRLYVTREALLGFAELPLLDEPVVTGTLLRTQGDTLVLRVPVTTRREGFRSEALGQVVLIPRSQVIQLERRRLHPLGTGIAAVGSTALATGLVVLIIDGALTGGQRAPGPGDSELAPHSPRQ